MANNHIYSPIISVEALKLLTNSPASPVIVDVSNEKDANKNYLNSHLAGAIFLDLNAELAEINADLSLGGRHPLPPLRKFLAVLSNAGISEHSHVVIYDHKNGANAAARFWWMLKSIGHKKVQVLDGGFQEAEKKGFPINSNPPPQSSRATYHTVTDWQWPIATLSEVEQASVQKDHLIIDVREPARYRGESEPIDLIAGHIPNAINIPYTENLRSNGLFEEPEILREKYQKVLAQFENEKVIVHCGSGVTACHTLLALAYAGLSVPTLYPGSWSEWSRNKKPIETITQK